MKFPVLQSFEKDLNKIVFVINQLSRGLDEAVTNIDNLTTLVGTPRRVLTANTTWNVATPPTGNDSTGNGSIATPYATIGKALDVIVSTVDLAGFDAIVKVADGIYTTGARVLEPHVGGGRIVIRGNTTTPTNVVWSVTGGHCLYVESITSISIEYMRLKTTSSGHCLYSNATGKITLGTNLDFNTCAGYHMLADFGGVIIIPYPNTYTISGGGLGHWGCSNGHLFVGGITITISNTPAFTGAFATCVTTGLITCNGNTFPGTGCTVGTKKFDIMSNAVINTFGAGAAYLPGGAAGTTASGGLYL